MKPLMAMLVCVALLFGCDTGYGRTVEVKDPAPDTNFHAVYFGTVDGCKIFALEDTSMDSGWFAHCPTGQTETSITRRVGLPGKSQHDVTTRVISQ